MSVRLASGMANDFLDSTYVTSFKSKWDLSGSAEDNEKDFRKNFKQPVFTAIDAELPSVIPKLLDAGADVNTLSQKAHGALDQKHSHNGGVHSLLDAVRKRVKELSDFLTTNKITTTDYRFPRVTKPMPLEEDEEYLRGRVPGTYVFWSTSEQLKEAKTNYERNLKQYEESEMSKNSSKGTAEKKAAIESQLAEFETLEAQLVERGAKTFKEMYPDLILVDEPHYHYHHYERSQPEPWTPSITFQVPDLTDELRAAYIRLFQACWDGDLPTVKEMTLSVWGENEHQSPLRIAVRDSSNFSPFSIAVLREHNDLAKACLEIAHAQYAPAENTGKVRHTVGPPAEESDDDSCDGTEDDFQIYTEILDDRFTIEGIGAVQGQVKSTITPLEVISWSCPVSRFLEDNDVHSMITNPLSDPYGGFRTRRFGRYARKSREGRSPRRILKDAVRGITYEVPQAAAHEHISEVEIPGNLFQLAIYLDDEDLLDFLITMGEVYTIRKASSVVDDDETKSNVFRFDEKDFRYAIDLGRISLLQHIIRRTGAGMPLDNLVKKSGVEVVKKPNNYQGLSVHGKKRADWANAGRQTQCETQQDHHPPLLHAARLANLESVEWFLSDAAPRCYREFANVHQEDVRIQNLGKAIGGLEASINNWLGLRAHLLIHCVILHKTTPDAEELLRYLCKTRPEAIESRSSSGLTPLHLAFSLHRVKMIKILIEAGANQTCRNNARDNIVHSLLTTGFKNDETDEDITRLRELLNVIDPRLIPSLFEERTTELPGAATPLARWLHTYVKPSRYNQEGNQAREKFLSVLLEFSKGEDLSIINAEGDTPVHSVVRAGADSLLPVMLKCRPELLFRENATGRTPYEMAEDAYLLKQVFNDPPSLLPSSPCPAARGFDFYRFSMQPTVGIIAEEAERFIEGLTKDARSNTEKVWEVCKEIAAKSQGTKRKLVKLVEANEVAKRLTKRKGSQTEEDKASVNSGEAGDVEETKGDEVDVWYGMGLDADS
ncbi:hypothetical protein IAQ61_010353 [Plenodomus lingam]|uniref:uncharacterized protein n=1 Tax=Leptosphaeria maculans TaxID=5022 RepID=UPI0033282508|nr:hypothetical protein IAQ61_010353 [Plenodomus lingam]